MKHAFSHSVKLGWTAGLLRPLVVLDRFWMVWWQWLGLWEWVEARANRVEGQPPPPGPLTFISLQSHSWRGLYVLSLAPLFRLCSSAQYTGWTVHRNWCAHRTLLQHRIVQSFVPLSVWRWQVWFISAPAFLHLIHLIHFIQEFGWLS